MGGEQDLEAQAVQLQADMEAGHADIARTAAACQAAEGRVRGLELDVAREQQARVRSAFLGAMSVPERERTLFGCSGCTPDAHLPCTATSWLAQSVLEETYL